MIGFPPSHEESARFRGVSRKALRRAVLDALDAMNWSWNTPSPWRVTASIPISFGSWGETVTVEIDEGKIWVRSECVFPLQFIDYGKNLSNVRRVITNVEESLDY